MKKFLGKRQLSATFYADTDGHFIKRGIVRFKIGDEEVETAMDHSLIEAIQEYFEGGCKKFHKPASKVNPSRRGALRAKSGSF